MLIKSWKRHYAARVILIAALQSGFIVAKLTGMLTWHWLLIFAPLLLTGTIFVVVLCVAALLILMSD